MHVPGSWYIRFFNLKFVGHCQMMTNQVLTSTFKKGVYSLVNLFLKSGSFFAWPTFELKLNKYLGWMVQKNDRNNKIHRHMVTVGLRSLLNLWNELKLWVHFFDIWYPGPDRVQLTFWSKSRLHIFKNQDIVNGLKAILGYLISNTSKNVTRALAHFISIVTISGLLINIKLVPFNFCTTL